MKSMNAFVKLLRCMVKTGIKSQLSSVHARVHKSAHMRKNSSVKSLAATANRDLKSSLVSLKCLQSVNPQVDL